MKRLAPAPADLSRPVVLTVACALLAAAFLQMRGASAVTAAVVDEPVHLTAGYLSLERFDLSINREHPPLLKALAAAPLLLLEPTLPPVDPTGPRPGSEDFEFDYSRRFLYRANDGDRLLTAARVPIMILTLALGALVFTWARDIAGDAAGLAALFLYALEPNILAHGRLVTTDLGAAAFSLAFLWSLRRAMRSGDARWTVGAGILLGCALLSKFSTLLLLPIGAVLIALDGFLAPGDAAVPTALGRLAQLGRRGLVILAVAWVMLEAGYGFQGAPLPYLYLDGLSLARLKNATVEGPTYLMGHISTEGFRSYYLIALGVKLPLPLLALAAAGALFLIEAGPRRREGVWLFLPALGWIVAMSLMTRAQIGVRYVLPVAPLLCVAAGCGAAGLLSLASPSRRVAAAAVVAALLCWQTVNAVRIYPYHLAYFNEIAGGPDRGWKWLADSNLDWGQDLIGLRLRLDALGGPAINLFYFGTADPEFYRIRHHPYGAPEPGLFAISATHLTGVYLPDPDYLADFRSMTPVETIGHSILLYRLEAVPERLRRPLAGPAR